MNPQSPIGDVSSADPARSARLAGVLLLSGLLLAALAGSWIVYRVEASGLAEQLEARETIRVSLLARLLESELRPAGGDLRQLAEAEELRDLLASGSDDARASALRHARMVSLGNPNFDQVRYIDEQGMEVLRITQGGNVIPPERLQIKLERPYFQQANVLPPGSLFISAFDLSQDLGEIEIPYKPVIRFAVPVFDSTGARRGIYIINYLGANLITRLEEAMGPQAHRLRLVSGSGSWIRGAQAEQEWGTVVPERAQHALARSAPELWTQILQQADGRSGGEHSLFTWQRVDAEDFSGRIEGERHSLDPFLVVASEIAPAEWSAQFDGLRRMTLLLAAGLAAVIIFAAWMFQGRRRMLLELRAMNRQLEDRVSERTAALASSVEELGQREHLLEETGHLAKVGGWEFDPATGKGTWTAEIARIHDIDTSVHPTKELGLQFYPGESRTRLEAALQRSLADGTPYDLELEFVSASGERKWVRTISRPEVQDGRVTHMRGAMQDITSRKISELRLQAQLQRLNLLERTTRAIGERQDLQSILRVVILTLEEQMPLDFACVCLYDANSRMLTVAATGVASAALAEQLALKEQSSFPIDQNGLSRCVSGHLVYEDDIAASRFPFPQRLAGAGLRAVVVAPLQVESQVFGVLVAARREPRSFNSSDCEFLRQLSEHVALAANQAQLYEALKSAYDDLRNTQQAVMQQERLRVLGQMASGIAHDINNAISPIMLFTDTLLERETGLSPQARTNLTTIQQAVSDVAETVARMREFYRQREPQAPLQPVNLNALTGQMKELTRARWENIPQQQGVVIDVRLDLASDIPLVQGIESEIREALTNLIFNAADAMPEGGIIGMRTWMADSNRICVTVSDTGIGMDEETLRRCLEPFFTTKGERGTGLGLPMVYGVMQRHGGSVEIDSRREAGTRITLVFQPATAIANTPDSSIQETPTGLNILVVDDDPILLHTLRETLQLDGHHIVAASGGQEGIDVFRDSLLQGSRPFSVVITDLGMPHVDGRAVAAAVKRQSPETPVLLLTGWGERLLSEGQQPPNVDLVLGKPPRLRDLRMALAKLLTRKEPIG